MSDSFRVLYERMCRLENERNKTIYKLAKKMEEKLGIGWSIDSNQVDGVVVVCPNDGNYSVGGDLINILKLPKNQAIEEILKWNCD